MNTAKALTKPAEPQLVEFDRRVDGPGATMQTLAVMQSTIGEMNPDDLTIEIDTTCADGKTTTRLKLRAYKHRPKD